MTARHHGGARPRSQGEGPLLDFSANLNPYGPPAAVLAAAKAADVTAYPDPEYLELRTAIAERTGVGTPEILAGNGSSELLFLVARALLCQGDTALLFAPCFGDYYAAVEAAGAGIVEARAHEATGFGWDMEDSIALARRVRPRTTFLARPNNPTGVFVADDDVVRLADALAPGVLVLDEAFIDFVEGADLKLMRASNVVTVRSFTKAYTIPGLRSGYMIAPEGIIAAAAKQQPTWSVGAPAVAAALACLEEGAFLEESRHRVATERASLVAGLRGLNVRVFEGAANFVLIGVTDAAKIAEALLNRGIAVRDCTSFGLPGHIRVSVRRREDNETLIAALRGVLRGG